jgi:MYXO-CTERM domain-containing protein
VFTGNPASATRWDAGEITPIPEASSYGLIMAALSLGALAAWRLRRES